MIKVRIIVASLIALAVAPAAGMLSAAPAHAVVIPGAPNTKAAQNRQCLACHGVRSAQKTMILVDGVEKSIYINTPAHYSSPHSVLSCASCHVGFKADEHSAAETAGWLQTAKLTACSNCHAREYTVYSHSVHGRAALKGGSAKAPLCADCHGSHAILSISAPQFRGSVIVLCGRCHPDEEGTYLDTYHGQATGLGSTRTPVCMNCHGAHQIQPPSNPASLVSKQHIIATCRQCHPNADRSFTTFLVHANPKNPHSSLVLWPFEMGHALLIGFLFTFGALHSVMYIYRGRKDGLYRRDRRQEAISPTRERVAYAPVIAPVATEAKKPIKLHYRRFSASDRWAHAFVMLSFTLLCFTGMPLRYSTAGWAKFEMDHLLGGVQVAGIVHRLAALILVACVLFELVRFGLYLLRRKGPVFGPGSILPASQDLRDAKAMFRWFFGKGPRPHEFDRYTYWEKFEFCAASMGVLTMIATGLILWFPVQATRLLPGVVLNIAMINHGGGALMALGFVFVFWHFFHVHMRPEIFPMDTAMFDGTLPIDQYARERSIEFDRRVRAGLLDEVLVEPHSGRRLVVEGVAWRVVTYLAVAVWLAFAVFIVWLAATALGSLAR